VPPTSAAIRGWDQWPKDSCRWSTGRWWSRRRCAGGFFALLHFSPVYWPENCGQDVKKEKNDKVKKEAGEGEDDDEDAINSDLDDEDDLDEDDDAEGAEQGGDLVIALYEKVRISYPLSRLLTMLMRHPSSRSSAWKISGRSPWKTGSFRSMAKSTSLPNAKGAWRVTSFSSLSRAVAQPKVWCSEFEWWREERLSTHNERV
jgi:hypothetical protein